MSSIKINKKLQHIIYKEKVLAYAASRITESYVAYPSNLDDCKEIIKFSILNNLTICPRGSGYSFADVILNNGNLVMNFSKMNLVKDFNPNNGQIIVEPGVCLSEVLLLSLALNFTLVACPGGSDVSIGGAIANNVHGKDSWKVGNFGENIVEIKLLKANFEIVSIRKEENNELFEAVVSGLGLIGIIIEVTLELKKIPSPFVSISTIPTSNLQNSIKVIEESKENYDFIVNWSDVFPKKTSMGRGFVSRSKWINHNEKLSSEALKESMINSEKIFDIFPSKVSWSLLRLIYGQNFTRVMNTILYNKTKLNYLFSGKKEKVLGFSDYTFMFRKLPGFTDLFKPDGFLHFQPLIPKKAGVDAVTEVMNICKFFKYNPLICGIKSHSKDNNMLSYSGDGYSIGIDVSKKNLDINNFNMFKKTLFQHTIDCNGKIYLAKDESLSKEMFQLMYPRYAEFLRIKKKLDPSTLFSSDMYIRLLKPL